MVKLKRQVENADNKLKAYETEAISFKDNQLTFSTGDGAKAMTKGFHLIGSGEEDVKIIVENPEKYDYLRYMAPSDAFESIVLDATRTH